MAFSRTAVLGLSLAVAGCGGAHAPHELRGLWSAGEAACAAGVGVRFENDAISAIYEENQRQTLFAHPYYTVESRGDAFRVRITYQLPHQTGGARVAGAEGVIELVSAERGPGVEVASHNLLDHRTGSARVRIENDPAVDLLRLVPCGEHPWVEGLRGRR